MSMYERCAECGLKIRCLDAEKHEKGFHHKRRIETLKAIEVRKQKEQFKIGTAL